MQANVSPIKGIYHTAYDQSTILDCARKRVPFDPIIFIDGLFIHGHRVFGLPPTEPTYFCKWDFDLGDILLNGPLEIIQYLGRVGSAIGYTYSDTENSLLISEPIIYDVTYLSLTIASLKIRLNVDDCVLETITSQVSFNLNDLNNNRYSARVTLSIPQIQMKIMKKELTSKHSSSHFLNPEDKFEILACIRTSILITDFIQKRDFDARHERQQEHIAIHDAPFDRCSFLLDEHHRVYHEKPMGNIIPSIPIPVIPPPLTKETIPLIDPNLTSSFTKEDNDDNNSSVSSKSKYSSSNSSYKSSLDDNEEPEKRSVRFNVGGNSLAGNAFMPPESWKKFEQISKEFNCRLPKFDMNPTSYYSSDEGITPKFSVQSNTEYDSIIIQLGELTGFLVPKSLVAINQLIDVNNIQDLQSTMDSIQVDVLNRLNSIRTAQPEIKNFKIVVASVNIKYGTVTGFDVNELINKYEHDVSHLSLQLESLNVSLRMAQDNAPQNVAEYLDKGMQDIPSQLTAYISCDKINLGIVRGTTDIAGEFLLPGQYDRPLFLQIDNPDMWWHESNIQNTGYFHLKNINFSVFNESIPWIASFVELNVNAIKNLSQDHKQAKAHTNQLRSAYVLSILSSAGETFKIEEDPSVLTRPTFVTRSPSHVRTNDSWKIMMRLRHILKSVPKIWKHKYDHIVQTNSYHVDPKVAQREVIRVFRRWRSWELSGMDDSYVFRHVFNVQTFQDTLLSKSASLNIDLESIALRINYLEDENFLCFDYLKLSFSWKGRKSSQNDNNTTSNQIPTKESESPIEAECTAICSNVRLLLDLKLLHTIEEIDNIIIDYNDKFFQNPDFDQLSSASSQSSDFNYYIDSHGDETSTGPKGNQFPPIKLSLTGCLQNISILLDFVTVGLVYESQDITFSADISQLLDKHEDIYLDMCFVSHIREIEFGIREKVKDEMTERNLVGILLNDYKGTFITSGLFKTTTKYAVVSNEKFEVVVDAPVEIFVDVIVRILDTEMKLVKDFIEVIENNHKSPDEMALAHISRFPSSSNPSIISSIKPDDDPEPKSILSGFNVIARIYGKDSSLRFNVTDSMSLYLETTESVFVGKLTGTNQIACEVTVTEQQFEILARNSQTNQVRPFFVVTIPSITSLILSEESDGKNFVESVINVKSIESRMMPISSLLLMIKSGSIEDEIRSTIKSIEMLNDRITALAQKSPVHPEVPVIAPIDPIKNEDRKIPAYFNLTLSIVETQVIIPSFDSSLALKLHEINTTLSAFYYDMSARKFNITPFFGDVSVHDVIWDLRNDTWGASSASEIVRLQISMSYSGRDEVTNKQRIDISSNRVHVMLCQRIVEKLVNIANTLEEGINDFYPVKSDGSGSSTLKPPDSDSPQISLEESVKEQFRALKKLGEKTTLRMSLNNFCFAWLFEEDYIEDQYPIGPESKGLLFGYNSLQISTSNLSGKTILSGVYITPTYDEQNIFALSGDESSSMNTAYLSSVKMTFMADLTHSAPHVYVQLSGDSLRVTILPSIVAIVFCLVKCISNTLVACSKPTNALDDSKNGKAPASASSNISPPPSGSRQTQTDHSPEFSLPLSFKFSVHFDGATIILFKDSPHSTTRHFSYGGYQYTHTIEDTSAPKSGENEPAVTLQSPAVNAKIEYLKEDSLAKRDAFNAEILISSSTNKIYPRIVPPVVEMWRIIQNVLKQSTFAQSQAVPATPEDDNESLLSIPDSFQDIDIDSQFGNIIVDINIRLQRQEIMLSCEPKAKVAATVAYDDFCISLNSFEDTIRKTTYGLSVRLHNFNSSLQHIYSREVSGQVTIEDIFLFATIGRNSAGQQSVLVATKISDIDVDVNLKQSQDLELFQDIWTPQNILGESHSHTSLATFSQLPGTLQQQINPSMLDGAVMRKYRRVTSTTAIPWCFDFCLANIKGKIDLGQAVGKATFTLDKLWLSSQKSSNWEQNLSIGFDEIKVISKGRFGGVVSLRKIQLSTAIMWQKHNGTIYPVPLVQAIMGVESLEARATFDYHSFAILAINALHVSMFNQRDKNFVLNDRLAVVGNCDSIYVFATSLAASNILDLYYTIERMRREAHASYDAILRDSANVTSDDSERKTKTTPLQMFDRLRTFLDVNINLLSVHIYPDTLMDSQVFTINVEGAEARYSQEIEVHEEFDENNLDGRKMSLTITNKEIVSQLDMKLHGLLVALATNRKNLGTEEYLISMTVEEYIQKASEAKGSTIIGIPLCETSMATWQSMDSNVVEYIFNSSFGGRVDVGWNLGSVNFIRSMWENHVRTFNARRKTYEMRYAAGTSSSLRPFYNDTEYANAKKKMEQGKSFYPTEDANGTAELPLNTISSNDNDSLLTTTESATSTSTIATPSTPQPRHNVTFSLDTDSVDRESVDLSPTTSSEPSFDSTSLSEFHDPVSDGEVEADGIRGSPYDNTSGVATPNALTSKNNGTTSDPKTPENKPNGESDLDVAANAAKDAPYIYIARVPPVIAQPQLRDMGEATPPVEWIGLHRKKLPSFVHQVIMVPLEKAVEEVDIVYRKVLGRS